MSMAIPRLGEEQLLHKLRQLPPEKVAEVKDFVEFLYRREEERKSLWASAKASEAAFARVWDNDDDADYDRL
jgi:hypothetical protein